MWKHGVRFLGMRHEFLDAEVMDCRIEMQRRGRGDWREISRSMEAGAAKSATFFSAVNPPPCTRVMRR